MALEVRFLNTLMRCIQLATLQHWWLHTPQALHLLGLGAHRQDEKRTVQLPEAPVLLSRSAPSLLYLDMCRIRGDCSRRYGTSSHSNP